MAEKPDVKTDPKTHGTHVPPSRASEDARQDREAKDREATARQEREAQHAKDAVLDAKAKDAAGELTTQPLADPIQLTGAALIPPAVVDDTLLPEEDPSAREGDDVLRPDMPDVKTLTGAEQGRYEVLTGQRLQRDEPEPPPPTAKRHPRETSA